MQPSVGLHCYFHQGDLLDCHVMNKASISGSGSEGDDIASRDATSSQGSDGSHHSQVSHYPIIRRYDLTADRRSVEDRIRVWADLSLDSR